MGGAVRSENTYKNMSTGFVFAHISFVAKDVAACETPAFHEGFVLFFPAGPYAIVSGGNIGHMSSLPLLSRISEVPVP